ncbi:telomere-binding protein cav [Drosophila ficusphila]|uniref:telomere-binding protein cav n=1 Tax=Drosophila ficusphila TaxID=30025 RepID=UPI0007E67DE9|nr:telomere-binding protein cav [Drosophila ficusphila]
MPVRKMSDYLKRYFAEEKQQVMEGCEEENKELTLWMYNKTSITEEDLARTYTEDEVRELCQRTKVKVKMTVNNCLYDAKKRFDRKNRLTNRSERFVNAMLIKAVSRKMVTPYSDKEMENYLDLASAQTKKDNNARLDRWSQKRGVIPTYTIPETEDQEPEHSAVLNANDVPSPTSLTDPDFYGTAPPEGDATGQPDRDELEWGDIDDLAGIGVEDEQPHHQTIGVEDEQPHHQTIGVEDEQPHHQTIKTQVEECPDTQLNETWMEGLGEINSESMSLGPELGTQSTQNTERMPNTESEYDVFGTQVPVSSTQE